MANREYNLLILEDSFYTRYDVASNIRRLHPYNYRILMSESISDACELIESKPFDLIIANTTVCDGETIDFFRDYSLKIPVIFYSGYDYMFDSLQNLNVVDYLKLPVTFEAIRDSLDRYEAFYQ